MRRYNPSIQLRRAGADDAASIAAVLSESFAEYKSSYTPKAFAATTPTPEEIQKRVEEGPIWVAFSDDMIVGTVSSISEGEALYIRSMAVLPSARGQHIGELLLEQIERFASGQGCRRLILSTTPFLTRAISLYQRFGFRRTNDGPHDLFGTPLFTMAKNLKPTEERET